MKSMNTQVDCGTFSNLNNLILYLFPCFFNDFFNTGRMNSAVGNQLMKASRAISRRTGSNADRYNGFRCIINNDFNSGCSFQCPDITTFPSDDPSLDLITFNIENSDRIFNGSF